MDNNTEREQPCSNKSRYESVLEAVLRISGWYPGRHVPFTDFEKHLNSNGKKLHDKAREFLHEFYGLGITTNYYGASGYEPWFNESLMPFLNKEKKERTLIIDFIGFGIDPKGNFWLPKFSPYDCDSDIEKITQSIMGMSCCLIGYEFSSCKEKRKLFPWFHKKSEIITPGMIDLDRCYSGSIYMTEDGQVIYPCYTGDYAEVYKNIKSFIFHKLDRFLLPCADPNDPQDADFLKNETKMEYVDYGYPDDCDLTELGVAKKQESD